MMPRSTSDREELIKDLKDPLKAASSDRSCSRRKRPENVKKSAEKCY
jgi:uncharacterized membrane protein